MRVSTSNPCSQTTLLLHHYEHLPQQRILKYCHMLDQACALIPRLLLVWGWNQGAVLGSGSQAGKHLKMERKYRSLMRAGQAAKGELEWGPGPLGPMLDPPLELHERSNRRAVSSNTHCSHSLIISLHTTSPYIHRYLVCNYAWQQNSHSLWLCYTPSMAWLPMMHCFIRTKSYVITYELLQSIASTYILQCLSNHIGC